MRIEKRYVIDNAQLMSEWNYEKNQAQGIEPQNITVGSVQKIWWICEKGHEWQATPNNRSRGQGCPVCAGRKVLVGYNDLASQMPSVAKEWHPCLNGELQATDVTKGSHKNVWWQCDVCGHEWQSTVSNRVAGKGCPVCSKTKQSKTKIANIISKQGSFGTCYPNLLEEWDYSKNEVSPYEITKDSTRKVWWKCKKCGYEWKVGVSYRTTRGHNCPACSNKVVNEQNCLTTTHPEVLIKWNYDKNSDITPNDVTYGSNKKVWWKCEKGHEWQATVNSIVSGGQCPICCGQKVLPGYNDLQTLYPHIAAEWHPNKNEGLLPSDITAGSSKKKIWWVCPRGHEYQATVANRTHGTGCPICDRERKTSFPEQAIYFYFKQITTAHNRYLLNGETEIDVFLPEYKIGIEYDGLYYHNDEQSKEKEKRKNAILQNAGITLFRVKESKNLEQVDTEQIIYCRNTPDYVFIGEIIGKLLERINRLLHTSFAIKVDINRDSSEIYSQYLLSEKENSLAVKRQDLAEEWHPTKNGFLKPDMVSCSSGKTVWWLGKCGHEWQMKIENRTKGSNCPYCSGKRVLVGFNDLETTHPQLIKEWDFEKNTFSPRSISFGSHKKVWWICENGHSYSATVWNRIAGKGCPYCINKKVLKGYNDLQTLYPHIAAEWDVVKNGAYPDSVTPGSNKRVWWKCSKCGHQWETNPNHRVYRNSGCPACSGRVATESNNLLVTNPLLCNEWNYDRNDKGPTEYKRASNQKVWWRCSKCGYEWKALISERSKGTGCPCCAGKEVVSGINDLSSVNPALAKEWNYKRNEGLTPEMVTSGTHKKVWWKCPICNHEWVASVNNRNRGRGCPKCGQAKTQRNKRR